MIRMTKKSYSRKATHSRTGQRLQKTLSGYDRMAIAFSGGVDSTLLAYAARLALGTERVLLVHLDTPLNPPAETAAAQDWARQYGMTLTMIRLDPRSCPEVRHNDPRRCYFCKRQIMAAVREAANRAGIAVIADGANRDDLNDYRPGMQAAEEAGVRHPLIEAGLNKAAIRRLARQWRLTNWNAPAAACLASRIRYGTELDDDLLQRIAAAETYLTARGFRGCRVRDHNGHADLEVAPMQFPRLLKLRVAVVKTLKALGFQAVSFNLEGYRQGAMNADLHHSSGEAAS